nr:hypothetical protein [uncultured Carboxylicivirga sp.]
MKKFGFFIWVMILSALLVGCERWGGRLDNLDSDRPSDVGPESGQRGNGGSTDLGSLYGDLYFILRNSDGTPVYNHGFVQPLAYVNDEPFTYTEGNEVIQYVCAIDTIEGELIVNKFIDEFGVESSFPQNDGNVYGPMEVEFGRTSIFRSPQKVLDQALEEAMSGLAEVEDISTLRVDFCGRLFGIRPDGSEKTIDSPRENMAIYQSLMENQGYQGLIAICDSEGYQHLKDFFNSWSYHYLHCAAGCLSAANDKTGTMSVNKLEYLNAFKNIIGTNPISDELGKLYFNYSAFTYTRDYWKDVKIGFLVWNGVYDTEPVVTFTVYQLFDMGIGEAFGYGTAPSFTTRSDNGWAKYTDVGGFAQFADDCNQVLEYVHDDSNIVWVY